MPARKSAGMGGYFARRVLAAKPLILALPGLLSAANASSTILASAGLACSKAMASLSSAYSCLTPVELLTISASLTRSLPRASTSAFSAADTSGRVASVSGAAAA